MLQFTLIPHTQLPADNQATIAISAGCKWIEADPAQVNETELNHIIELCKQAEIILTFKHDDVLLDKHRVHGLHLSPTDVEPQSIRDRLGGHPIIGVDVSSDVDLKRLKRADVDYLVIPDFPSAEAYKTLNGLCRNIAESGIDFPVVAQGVIPVESLHDLLAAGANGINIDLNSLQGPLFEPALKAYIEACNQ